MHRFETTQDAYAATQCGTTYDESQGHDIPIRNGETLIIESEGVVGICDTWPVAVTEAPGDLHAVGDWGAMLARKGITLDCIRLAAAQAEQLGYPLAPALVAFLDAHPELAQCTYDEAAALGFDQCAEVGRRLQVACSKCNARVIDGAPTHETGCSNARPLRIAVTVTLSMHPYDYEQDCEYIERIFGSIGQTLDPAASVSIDAR